MKDDDVRMPPISQQGTTIAAYQRSDGVYYPLAPQPVMINIAGIWINTDQIATVSIPFSIVTLKDGSKYGMPKGGWKEVIDNMQVPQTIHLD